MAAPANAPTLSVHVGSTKTRDGVEVKPVLLKVTTPMSEKRVPSDIVVVIDVSESMKAEAKIKSEGGGEEGHGLTLLDIAKHGVNTIIKTLGTEDRLSVVMFNHCAEIMLELTTMDEAGQKRATEKVEGLEEGGGTNIWAGLQEAMKSLDHGAAGRGSRLGHVMLLTDGYTSNREVVMSNLEYYRTKHERLPGTLSTFGFGYYIDSPLLTDIAKFGDGTYSFIPDPGFVGTVFINTLSNLLCTFAREVWVNVDAEDTTGGNLLSVMGIGERQLDAGGKAARIRLGTLQYEQPRSAVLLVDAGLTGALFAAVSYSLGGQANSEAKVEFSITSSSATEDKVVEPDYYRGVFVETVSHNMAKLSSQDVRLEDAAADIRGLASAVEGSSAAGEPFLAALVEDLRGQSLEAFSKDEWYKKWGLHYMPSIMFAHSVQQCNNFKDPSVQLFGGDLFKEIQELADEMFDKLPPPKPRQRGRPSAAAPAQPVSMAAYNNRYGFCIDAACLVKLAGDGGYRAAGELQKGDRIEALGGGVGEVICLVRTCCTGGKASMVELRPGVRVTPYHPVLSDGQWRFPMELGMAEERPCTAVCSLVLSGSPAVGIVGDDKGTVFAAALGHGLQDGALAHPYFGGPRVLENLRSAPGFNSGLLEIAPGNIVRDPDTGLVSGFVF